MSAFEISPTELAEMRVDAERGDLSSKDSLRLIAEVERLTANAGPPYHVIDLRFDGWTIKHPLSCRPDLFNCQVARVVTKQLQHYPGRSGQYRVDLIGDDILRVAQLRETVPPR